MKKLKNRCLMYLSQMLDTPKLASCYAIYIKHFYIVFLLSHLAHMTS